MEIHTQRNVWVGGKSAYVILAQSSLRACRAKVPWGEGVRRAGGEATGGSAGSQRGGGDERKGEIEIANLRNHSPFLKVALESPLTEDMLSVGGGKKQPKKKTEEGPG